MLAGGIRAPPSVLRLAYHIPQELQEPKIELADLRPNSLSEHDLFPKTGSHFSGSCSGNQRPSRSGAIFLQASTGPCTEPTDLSKASRSLPERSISTTRSTPLEPITTGTPTYMSFTPYSPLR